MTNFRGEVVPVFAVDQLFDTRDTAAPKVERSRVLVLSQASQVLGIQVDQVDEMVLQADQPQLPNSPNETLLDETMSCQNRTFRPVSLPFLFHSLQQTLSNVTLKLLQ